jgi:hypothetical protein
VLDGYPEGPGAVRVTRGRRNPGGAEGGVLMFSRTATTVVGFLLLTVVMLATYQLWDVALARWFR